MESGKTHRACRELELKHGFAPDNGCWAMRREIVSFAKLPLNVIARTLDTRKKTNFSRVCCADSGRCLRSEPVNDWLSLHRRLAEDVCTCLRWTENFW